ncbi:MAG: 2OG-Fe(II) oxygenase [Rhizobiales bacterium]|nr:2OG-Fe(II) oxygenase [Hyphomicrobiales bacterium]
MIGTFKRCLETTAPKETPYKHWILERCIPEETVDAIIGLPFKAPDLGGVSGKRELHNATRTYFDRDNSARHEVVHDFAEAFQARETTDFIEKHCGLDLSGTYLRIEYAQDTGGFWLEPHTDLGVKKFTMLVYISRDPAHANLGTDIYDGEKRHVGRSPFRPGGALIFVPSNNTYHGFEPRDIPGVRQSVIINYVTNEWRAREQLAFPDSPIA